MAVFLMADFFGLFGLSVYWMLLQTIKQVYIFYGITK